MPTKDYFELNREQSSKSPFIEFSDELDFCFWWTHGTDAGCDNNILRSKDRLKARRKQEKPRLSHFAAIFRLPKLQLFEITGNTVIKTRRRC